MTEYTAICKRVDRWWEITVPDLEGAWVTQTRHLRDVEATVKGLVVLMAEVPEADVKVSVQVPQAPEDRLALRELVVHRSPCPGCRAVPGERCTSTSGRFTSIHILRTNYAKRYAAPGLCPLGCGDQLQIVSNSIGHVKSGLFECTPEGARRG